MNRRTFFLGGGAAFAQTVSSRTVRIGVIGSGGRGRYHTVEMKKQPDTQVTAVCDVYEPNLEAGLSAAGPGAHAYRNYRKLLESKDVDAVFITTPDHWHYQMVIDALAAGKHVYVEKPLCRTPEQGLNLIAAARSAKTIVQVGMQRRSYSLYQKARQYVSDGTLGNVYAVRAWWVDDVLKPSNKKLEGPLDWEQFQGPAERRPLTDDRFLNWRSYSEYSGGYIADIGAHIFDAIHMFMGATYPSAVNATAIHTHAAAGDVPETFVVAAEYPQGFLAVFTLNYAGMKYKMVNDNLTQLDGQKARMDVGRERVLVFRRREEEKPAITEELPGGMNLATQQHVANFLECVRSGRQPNATVEIGFQSALVCQMGVASLSQGRRLRWNVQRRQIET